jgi:activator of HSP90 ATPase
VKSVTSCTGDATVACIRGRVKHGFDYEVQLTWSYSVGGREVTGLLQLDVSRTAVCDEEVQYSSSYDKAKSGLTAAESAELDKLLRGEELQRALLERLKAFDAELAARCG